MRQQFEKTTDTYQESLCGYRTILFRKTKIVVLCEDVAIILSKIGRFNYLWVDYEQEEEYSQNGREIDHSSSGTH